jgi:hypothetical protein
VSRARAWVALAVLGGVWAMSAGSKKANQGPAVERDLALLVPAFRVRLLLVLDAMRRDGFKPFVWETYRSPERAAMLAEKGTGNAVSMHTLGLAADVIDAERHWEAPDFFKALHRHTLAQGLTRVHHGEDWDGPHVQAMPASYQGRMLAATPAERQALLLRLYSWRAA